MRLEGAMGREEGRRWSLCDMEAEGGALARRRENGSEQRVRAGQIVQRMENP